MMHLGGGTFLYSFPGPRYPVVGKIELGRKKYRNRGLGIIFISMFSMSILSIVSTSGTADPVVSTDELLKLESQGKLDELEVKSEEIKNKLYADGEHERPKKGKVKIINYKVRNGDTLTTIAVRKKVPARIIAASSGIKITETLTPGMVLQIPDKPGLIYRFKKGDTLAAVAQHYSVKIDLVMNDNPGVIDFDMIEPGKRVFLPNAKVPAPPIRWLRPIAGGRFTSGYGWRRNPLNRRRRHFHAGVDLGVAYRKVQAARGGQVTYAGWLGSYGNAIVIQHDNGYKTLYAHLSRVKVRRGQFVKMGKNIGVSGNTGGSTGPHLHFEVIKRGRPVNPRRYIRF